MIVIACGKVKGDHPTAACRLYRGGIAGMAIKYAERRGDPYLLLSAAHGVLDPTAVVAPYDRSLRSLSKQQRLSWGYQGSRSLIARIADRQISFLAGEVYVDAITPFLIDWQIDRPFQHRRVFEIRHLLAAG